MATSALGARFALGQITSLNGEIHSGRWIASKTTIYAAKYIKAGEAVVAEKALPAAPTTAFSPPPPSSVLCGKSVAMFRPSKPKNLLSGKFVEGKKLKHIDAMEKKRDWELDWEVPRRLAHEMIN